VNNTRIFAPVLRVALLWCAVLCAAQPRSLAGQSCEEPRCYSAREILQQFATEAEASTSGVGDVAVLHTLTRSSPTVSEARRDSIADGLMEQALGAGGSRTRIKAALYLTMAGSTEREIVLPDAAHRVVRLLRSSSDREVREMILRTVPEMKDRHTLMPILTEVASQPDKTPRHIMNHDVDEATHAVVALSRMGEQGRAALRDLRQRRAIRSERAASMLDNLSRQNPGLN